MPQTSMIGVVLVTVTDADGTVSSKKVYNKITNYTKNTLAKWMSGTPNTGANAVLPPTKIAAGNGIPPYGQSGALETDTALWSEIAGSRKVCDQIMLTQAYYAQFNLAYQMTDPQGYYNELGLFDANGNLWAHVLINQYKSSSQTLTVQWMIYMVIDTSNSGALVTNYTRTAIASWMSGTSNVAGTTGAIVPPTKIQLGTGTGQLRTSDTALWNPTTGTDRACQGISTVQIYNVQCVYTFQGNDLSGVFNEMGLIDTANNLWLHSIISINKPTGNILSIVAQIGIVGN